MQESGETDGPTTPTRRAVLVGSSAGAGLLAALPGFARTQNVAPPAPTTGATAVPGMGFSPRAFGAVGDGFVRPLADRFTTLEEARGVYPFAQRLDQSLDWAGIQAALDAAEPVGGMVLVPVGRFILSDTLRLPSGVTLQGESRNGSVIDNQHLPLDAPQLVNKDPLAFLYVTIRDLTLNGGTHALRVEVSREVAGIVIEGVTTNMQSEANFEFTSLQTCVIRDCHLMDGRFGLHVRGFPCNSVHLINSRLGRHVDASIQLRGADGFVMLGGSIEAGSTPGKATIDIGTGGAYAQAIAFESVYFENTHAILLRSRNASVLSFNGCKFTGTGSGPDGGPGAYQFDCGDDLIGFTDNFFQVPTTGPANMLVSGHNRFLAPGGTVWRQRDAGRAILTSRAMSVAEAREGLFTVALAGAGRSGAGHGSRAWGRMELFMDPGAGQPLRRAEIPFDLALDAGSNAPIRPIAPGLVDIRRDGEGLRTMLNPAAGADIGGRNLWFALDLSQAGSAAMDVNIL